jgi:hypothetical protein
MTLDGFVGDARREKVTIKGKKGPAVSGAQAATAAAQGRALPTRDSGKEETMTIEQYFKKQVRTINVPGSCAEQAVRSTTLPSRCRGCLV